MSIKDILNLLNSIAQTPDIIELRKFIAELLDKYNTELEKNSHLQNEIAELKKKYEKYDNWAKESKNYEPFKTTLSSIVYRHKKTLELFCPHCYETEKQFIHLQPLSDSPARFSFCPHCKVEYSIGVEER